MAHELLQLLDTTQVATVLRMSPAGVRKLIQQGEVRPDGRGGHRVALFEPQTIQDFIRRRANVEADADGGAIPGRRPVRDSRYLDGPYARQAPVVRAAGDSGDSVGCGEDARARAREAEARRRARQGRTRGVREVAPLVA